MRNCLSENFATSARFLLLEGTLSKGLACAVASLRRTARSVGALPELPHLQSATPGAQLKFHFPRSFVCLFFIKLRGERSSVQLEGRELAQPGNSAFGALEEANTAHLGSEFRNAAVLTLTPEFSKTLFTVGQELLARLLVQFALS